MAYNFFSGPRSVPVPIVPYALANPGNAGFPPEVLRNLEWYPRWNFPSWQSWMAGDSVSQTAVPTHDGQGMCLCTSRNFEYDPQCVCYKGGSAMVLRQ